MRGICSSGSNPRISAIIPAYNRESTIERAITSVLAQTLPPAEIIVVDDGSTDGTRRAVCRFGHRVRWIHQPNAGAAAARNRGVAEASSEWVAFLDSDDFWLEQHLERIAAAIDETAGRASLYFSDMRRPSEEDDVLLWDACGFSISQAHELQDNGRQWAMLSRQPMMLQSSVFDRRAYLEAGGLSEALVRRHDTHFFFKICLTAPCCAVAGCGTVMTADDSGGRLTSTHDSKSREYWRSTAWLYRDILSGPYPLRRVDRRQLRTRLAAAELRLAGLAWTERATSEAALHLARAVLDSPRRVLFGVRSRLWKGPVRSEDPS